MLRDILLFLFLQSASEQMAVFPCRPTNTTITGIFETGTPTVLTSTVTWRLRGSRMKPSISAFSNIYARSPDTSSLVTWTYGRSSFLDCKSYVEGPSLSSIFTTSSSHCSSRCAKCTIWRCRPSEVSSLLSLSFQ